jgi:hypothetical protein
VLRRDRGDAFVERYDGVTLPLRTSPVPATAWDTMLGGAGASRVRVYGATTEDLLAGRGAAGRFPPAMRSFAATAAAPGATWLVLVLGPAGGRSARTGIFARLGDRFLWVDRPWRVLP